MKTLIFSCIIALGLLNAYGNQTATLRAVESSFVFEDGTRISMKTDERECLKFVEITVGKNKITIAKEALGEIHDPRLYSVNFTKSGPDEWELTIQYEFRQYTWGEATSEVSIYFDNRGFTRKLTKIPTGKNTWVYKKQDAGKPEEDFGQGGVLPGPK